MRDGIYAKTIREIYDELDKETEQLFQIVDRKTYDLVLDEMERIINKNMYLDEQPFYLFTKECHKTFKDVYFVIGKWRLGMCGIFIKDVIDDVHILCDTKEDGESQKIHKKQIDNFIQILDSYRRSIIVCKKKYDEIRWKKIKYIREEN